jgi:hypothetical protein
MLPQVCDPHRQISSGERLSSQEFELPNSRIDGHRETLIE